MVMLLLAESMIAPAKMLAVVKPCMKAVLLALACKVPPSKLNVEEMPGPVVTTPGVMSRPPVTRLTTPTLLPACAMRRMLVRFTTPVLLMVSVPLPFSPMIRNWPVPS